METRPKRPTRRMLLAAGAALAAAGLGACATPPENTPVSGAPLPLSVISFGGGFNLPLWVARDQGFFARHGLAPTLNITPDSRTLFTGLMANRFDLAITAFDNIVAYQEGQGEVRFDPPSDFFAFMGSDDGFLSLVSVPEVNSVAELRGKTVSVDAMGNGFSFAMREMLARGGVPESAVQWARAGATDRRFAALMAREHAATMLRAPFDLQALNRGFHQIATVREVIGPYLGIVGAARRSWAAAHEVELIRFIRAYRDAIRWAKDPLNRAAAEALMLANVPGMTAALARQSCELLLQPQTGFFSDVQLDPVGVRAVLDLRAKLGEPRQPMGPPERYIDERYWKRAMAR